MNQMESIGAILARVLPELAKHVQPPEEREDDDAPPESGVRRIGAEQ